MTDKKRITVYLPEQLDDILEQFKDETGESKTMIMTKALEDYIIHLHEKEKIFREIEDKIKTGSH